MSQKIKPKKEKERGKKTEREVKDKKKKELVFLVFITYTLEKRFHRSRYHIDAHKRIHQHE